MTEQEIEEIEDKIFGHKSLEEMARMAGREVELFPNNPLSKDFIKAFKREKAVALIEHLAKNGGIDRWF